MKETATATAWSQTRYGGPEVLGLAPHPAPEPRAGQVAIAVEATSLNSADVRIMRGEPLLLRLFFGLRRPRTATPGRDVAGRISAVGPDVSTWQVGDRVVGELPGGGLSTVTLAPAEKIVRVPDDVDASTAASLPLAGGTAWQALDLARVGAGSRVLVIGAGGGVGSFAVRLAVLRGAVVDAWCRPPSHDMVRSLGASRIDDYRTALAPAGAYDAVIDIGGARPLRDLQRAVRPGGRVVGVAGGANRVFGPIGRMVRGAFVSIGAPVRIVPLAAVARPQITAELLALVSSGELRPHIERTYPLAHARAALTHLDTGHAIGKVVVRVG
jgi:NADPH:quinone reductase-like Zn-dependent oxidoreductase